MRKLWLVFFAIGLIMLLFSLDINFTGAIINSNIEIINKFYFYLGLSSICFSFLILTVSKSLEAIVIPTGNLNADRKRAERALEDYHNLHEAPYLLLTGALSRSKDDKPAKNSQIYQIYKHLRGYSYNPKTKQYEEDAEIKKRGYQAKPSDLIAEFKSRTTLENVLFMIGQIKKKGIKNLRIATNKTHFWRFNMFLKQAKKEGLIEEDVRIEPLYTSETPREFAYGVLAYAKDFVKLKHYGSLKKMQRNRK